MKNLMTYINPLKEFTSDYSQLVKVQIDNSRFWGWKDSDIMLVTNFPYSYEGIEAIVVPDELFFYRRKRASKINVICYLLENKMIDDMAWIHDFDAYQVSEFPDNILADFDAGFIDYATSSLWNMGSFFFKPQALSMFQGVREIMNEKQINDEYALKYLIDRDPNGMGKRYTKLNNTYNLGRMRENEYTYSISEKPIKVFHFHPKMRELYEEVKPLLPPKLIEIMVKHGY